MPLRLYPNIYASGSVSKAWRPRQECVIKYPVRNRAVLRELRRLLPGKWQKVIKQGQGGEAHYFEHGSGSVAGVIFLFGMGDS